MRRFSRSGFTLVELMIALVVSSLIVAAIYSAYLYNQRIQTAQDQVAEMQQNLRAAMNLMVQEIRMAGFDPSEDAGAEITVATQGELSFTADLDEDGDLTPDATNPNENITYSFGNDPDTGDPDDADGDGVADTGAASFRRESNSGGLQPIAENIVAVEFLYHIITNTSNPTTFTYTRNPAPDEMDQIRAVTISMLARASAPDQKYNNTRAIVPASSRTESPSGKASDNASWTSSGVAWNVASNYRRRLLVTTVKFRNYGL